LPDPETQNPQAQIRRRGSFDTVATLLSNESSGYGIPIAWYQEDEGKSESLSCASATTKGSLFVVTGTAPLSLPVLAQRPEAMFALQKKAIGFQLLSLSR
jgi:hypothetical protein